MIAPGIALMLALASPARCPIPPSAMMLMEIDVPGTDRSVLATFDLADASETCELSLPGGGIAVAQDGTIFAAITAEKETEFTTDAGHLDVFSPDGRLLHRLFDGMEGIEEIALDNRGHIFVSTGWPTYVNGVTVDSPRTLTMYDANSLTKIRTYPLDGNFKSYALSPDGRVLALCYSFGANIGHVDLIDPATGTRARRIDTPAESASFEGNTLLVGSQRGIVEITLPDGAVRPSLRKDFSKASRVVGGVEYTLVHGPVTFTGQQFTMTQTFTRRRLSDGAMLTPIVAKGLAGAYFIVHPNPKLASATPDPDIAPPVFPDLDTLRASVPSATVGVAFTDTVSGREYAYLGDLARIETPEREHTLTIVDCKHAVALVADTILKTYQVFPMDRVPRFTPTPAPTLSPQMEARYSQQMVTLEIVSTSRADWESPLAQSGYRVRFLPSARMQTMGMTSSSSEREYAVLPAAAPSCATRSFGGELSGIDPAVALDANGVVSWIQRGSPGVNVRGTVPNAIVGATLVHAVAATPGQTTSTSLNVTAFKRLSADAITLFSIPAGYTEVPLPNY